MKELHALVDFENVQPALEELAKRAFFLGEGAATGGGPWRDGDLNQLNEIYEVIKMI